MKTLLEMKAEICYYSKGAFQYTSLDEVDLTEFEYLYGWILNVLTEETDILSQDT